jgi:putative endonuclease
VKQFNYQIGKLGERKAWEYLQKNGYKLLEQNFHTRFGEIDLICTNKNKIIFVEVKLKVGEDFGTPEEMVSKKKVWQVQKTAEAFLQKNYRLAEVYPSWQIDVVAIVMNEDRSVVRISHYENITF